MNHAKRFRISDITELCDAADDGDESAQAKLRLHIAAECELLRRRKDDRKRSSPGRSASPQDVRINLRGDR